jgi:hypothetical protein
MKSIFPLFYLLCCFTACTESPEPVARQNRTSGGIYYDYQVWGEEGRNEVTIRLQYRRGDEEGDAVALEEPGQVMLDGEPLTADSTKFTGTYYELTKPATEFKGNHTISLCQSEQKGAPGRIQL